MKQTFPKVFFATEKLINSQARFVNFSDRGSLLFELGELRFVGRRQSLKIKNIQSIELISPRIPWISLMFSFAILLMFLGFIISRMPSDFIVMAMFIAMILLASFLPLIIFAQKAFLWVEVAFLDEENMLRRAYFLDASRLILSTFGSAIDDVLKMYRELRTIQSSAG